MKEVNLEGVKDTVILGLAIWRLSHMITWEKGVLGLNEKLRLLAGVRIGTKQDTEHLTERYVVTGNSLSNVQHTKKLAPTTYEAELPPHLQPTLLTNGLKCIWCVSFWLSIFTYICYLLNPKVTLAVCKPLALNALVIGINKGVS